jgi:hypothetical protein
VDANDLISSELTFARELDYHVFLRWAAFIGVAATKVEAPEAGSNLYDRHRCYSSHVPEENGSELPSFRARQRHSYCIRKAGGLNAGPAAVGAALSRSAHHFFFAGFDFAALPFAFFAAGFTRALAGAGVEVAGAGERA